LNEIVLVNHITDRMIQQESVELNEVTPKTTSYASLDDPEEGMALKFIPMKEFNG